MIHLCVKKISENSKKKISNISIRRDFYRGIEQNYNLKTFTTRTYNLLQNIGYMH